MGRKRMPQGMRSQTAPARRHFEMPHNPVLNPAGAQRPAGTGKKEMPPVRFSRIGWKQFGPAGEVPAQGFPGRRAHRHLSGHSHGPAVQIQTIHTDVRQFTQPDSGSVKQLQNRPVPQTQRRIRRRILQHPMHFRKIQMDRQGFFLPGRTDL